MEINVQAGPRPQPVAGSRRADLPVGIKTTSDVNPAPQAQAPKPVSDAEKQRYEAVARASAAVSELFAVSDKTFTIFRDASGQYITRYTSLRDGSVSYVPEPKLLQYAPSRLPGLDIQA
jgi:hypothetical protein